MNKRKNKIFYNILKAQSEIISMVLVVVIIIALVGVAYTWGLPLIQKYQSTAVVDRVASSFDQNNPSSLPSEIEFVANTGGEKTFNLDVSGLWQLDETENSISFRFASKVTNVAAISTWVSLTPGASYPPTSGISGKDKSSTVFARAEPTGDGYEIMYKVIFRELDESTTKGYKIKLEKYGDGPTSSTGKTIRIFFGGRELDTSIPGKTLSITKVKLLLV
jgi:hypothetical protein